MKVFDWPNIVFILLLLGGIIFGFYYNAKRSVDCEDKGGIPITGACLKKESVIK